MVIRTICVDSRAASSAAGANRCWSSTSMWATRGRDPSSAKSVTRPSPSTRTCSSTKGGCTWAKPLSAWVMITSVVVERTSREKMVWCSTWGSVATLPSRPGTSSQQHRRSGEPGLNLKEVKEKLKTILTISSCLLNNNIKEGGDWSNYNTIYIYFLKIVKIFSDISGAV